jgi:hypothetical protein
MRSLKMRIECTSPPARIELANFSEDKHCLDTSVSIKLPYDHGYAGPLTRIFNTSCTACTNNGIEAAYSFAKLVYLWFVMGIRITRVFFVWSLYCLSIFDLLLMITSLVSYDYLFGILWSTMRSLKMRIECTSPPARIELANFSEDKHCLDTSVSIKLPYDHGYAGPLT